IRPLRQMSGATGFFEVFLDGARAPLANVIGGLGSGWRVAMTTLGFERGGRATVAHLAYEREFWALVETARRYGRDGDPLVRQQRDPAQHRRRARPGPAQGAEAAGGGRRGGGRWVCSTVGSRSSPAPAGASAPGSRSCSPERGPRWSSPTSGSRWTAREAT